MGDKFLEVEDMKKGDKKYDHSDPPCDLESLLKDAQKCRENREGLLREKALQRRFEEEEPEKRKEISDDQKNDHSDPPCDLESLLKDVQKCRENRERLLREKALQRRFEEEEPEKRKEISYDEEKERNARFNIGNIVDFEWEKLEMEKKLKTEQSGVGAGEEQPRKVNRRKIKLKASQRLQDSNKGVILGDSKDIGGSSSKNKPSTKKSEKVDEKAEDSGPEMPPELKNDIQEAGGDTEIRFGNSED